MTSEIVEEPIELKDKLVDKRWKIRVKGYKELDQLIQTKDTKYIEYISYFEGMANDNNAIAFESALETMISYFSINDNSNPLSIEVGNKVCLVIGEKGLVGRSKTKERTLELFCLFIEIGLTEEVLNALIDLTKHKNFKLVVEAIKEIEQILILFSPQVFSLKNILEGLKEWIVHKDKDARQSSLRILHCLNSNFEESLLQEFINTIPPAQKKDYESYLQNNPLHKIDPVRNMRCKKEQKVISPVQKVVEKIVEKSLPEKINNVEKNVLEKKIPKEFANIIDNGKWKEKKEVIEKINEELEAPKVIFPTSGIFWETLKKALDDNNISVVSATMRCIISIDKKGGNVTQYLSQIVKRLKESNKILVNCAIETLLSINKNNDDLVSLLIEVEGNSISNLNVMNFARRAIEKFNKPTQQIKIWAKLFCSPLEDQKKETRDAATEAIVSFIKINGDEILKYLEGVSKDRLRIVQAKVNGESYMSVAPNTVNTNSVAQSSISQISEIPQKILSPIPIKEVINNDNNSIKQFTTRSRKMSLERSPKKKGIKSYSTTKLPVLKVNTKPVLRSAKTQPKKEVRKTLKKSYFDLFKALKNGDWKVQTQSLIEITKYLESSTINQIECDNLINELKNKIGDPKRGLASIALKTLIQIIKNIKTGFERYIPSIMSNVIQQMGDTNKSVRECSIEVMQTLGKEVGMNALINQLNYAMQPNNNPIIRKSAIEVILKIIEPMNLKEIGIMKPLVPTLLKQICDKNIELRKDVEYAIEKCVESMGVDIIKSRMNKLMINEQQACREIIRRYNVSQHPTIIEPNITEPKPVVKKLTHLITVSRDSEVIPKETKMEEEQIKDVNNQHTYTKMEEVPILPIRKSLILAQENNENTKIEEYPNINLGKQNLPRTGSAVVTVLNRCATISMIVEDTQKQPMIIRSQTMIPPELTLLYKIPETYIKDLLRLGAEMLPQDYLQRLVSLSPRDVDLCLKAVEVLDFGKPIFEEFLMTWGVVLIMKGDYTLIPELTKIVQDWIKKLLKNKKILEGVRTHTFIECILKSAQYISTEVSLLMKYFVRVYDNKRIIEMLWQAIVTSPLATKIVCLRVFNDLFETFIENRDLNENMMKTMFCVIYREANTKNFEDIVGFLLAKIYNCIGEDIFTVIENNDEIFNQYIRFNGKYIKEKEQMITGGGKRKVRDERITIVGHDQPISIAENNEDIILHISGIDKDQRLDSGKTLDEIKENGIDLEISEPNAQNKERPRKFSLTLQRGKGPIQFNDHNINMPINIENKPLEEIIPSKRMSEENSGPKLIDLEEETSQVDKTTQNLELNIGQNTSDISPLVSPLSTKEMQKSSRQVSPKLSPVQSPNLLKTPTLSPNSLLRSRGKKITHKPVIVPKASPTVGYKPIMEKSPVSSAVRVKQLTMEEQQSNQNKITTKRHNLNLIRSQNAMNKIEVVSPMVKPIIKFDVMDPQDIPLSIEVPNREVSTESNSSFYPISNTTPLGFLDKILKTKKEVPPPIQVNTDFKFSIAEQNKEHTQQSINTITDSKPVTQSPVDQFTLQPTQPPLINPQLLALQTSINSIKRVSPIRNPINQVSPDTVPNALNWKDLCK
ncbi:hypothetical protein, conserved [Entamoeba dispar SAW760]|uniref:TOG domain-containing protein n=1 Tax=Entamoeba dispar (strain ATCC PRA-260 / SAW760) TaxID=370354 RepID=B0ELT4_ENTDS|nr:uncharacterized protein EDI_229050 [Entamoeba dispar SAW760]EDR24527.1 hypothetical protein, conserved [Entamoeba dispar SAW760]|eukprot:EDR24527.1 hypothetical protein, conserved [Entamoeba dispar SAW760]